MNELDTDKEKEKGQKEDKKKTARERERGQQSNSIKHFVLCAVETANILSFSVRIDNQKYRVLLMQISCAYYNWKYFNHFLANFNSNYLDQL